MDRLTRSSTEAVTEVVDTKEVDTSRGGIRTIKTNRTETSITGTKTTETTITIAK